MKRRCISCLATIERCNGFVLARDIIAYSEGLIDGRNVRELCGRCVNTVEILPGEPPITSAIRAGKESE